MITALAVAIGETPFVIALSFLVIFRSYSGIQRRRTRARWAEDFFIWLSLLTGITNYGWQWWDAATLLKYQDSKDPDIVPLLGLPPGKATTYMKGAFFSDLAYVLTLWTIKAAFLAIQYDMTRAIPGWHRTLIYLGSVYLFFTFMFCFFMSFVYCRHDLSTLWSYTDTYCSCLNLNSMITTEWVMNFFGDIILAVLYILIILRLKIAGLQLLAFGFIFVLLGMTMTASTVAYANLIHINNLPDGEEADDSVFEIWGVWTFAEWAVALTAVCLPAIRVYFREKVSFTQTQRAIAEGRSLDPLNAEISFRSVILSKIGNWKLFQRFKANKPSTWSSSVHSEGFLQIEQRNAGFDEHELEALR